MGFLGGMFGPGLSFQAKPADLNQPVNANQLGQAYNQMQTGLGAQQSFVNALQGANGIAPGIQADLARSLAAQARGEGPNPAAAQLARTTQDNASRQAALMASQRGASQNAGAIARMAAQQGSQAQQDAIGQAAVLKANQQLAAQQALGQMTNQMIGQQQAALGQYGQLSAEQQRQLLAAMGQYNSTQAQQQAAANQINSQMALERSRSQNQGLGGLLNAAGAAIPFLGLPSSVANVAGAVINGFGGNAATQATQAPTPTNFDASAASGHGASPFDINLAAGHGAQGYAAGGQVEPDYSLPPIRFNPSGGRTILGNYAQGLTMSSGGYVPGRAAFGGDDYANDTVPAMLSPGEIVIPRSIVQGKDAGDKSKKFVEAILSKRQRL